MKGEIIMGKLIYKYFPYPFNLVMTIFGSKCKFENYDEDMIFDIINQLDKREQEIISYRFEKAMTYKQIGDALGIDDTRVSQLIHRCCHFIKIRYACHIIDNRVGIEKLGLCTKCTNALKSAGIKTIYDLMGYNKKSLSEVKGIGEITFKEIIHSLNMQGINTRRFR